MQMNARVIWRTNVRLGRDAHFAHLVHICTQQLIVHIRILVLDSHSTDLPYHVHRLCSLWSSRCLSPILFYHLSPLEKSLHRARTFAIVSPFYLIFSSSASPFRLFLCRERKNRRERRAEEETACQYIWRTIRNFYQRKFRAVIPRGHFSSSPSCTFKSYFSLLSRQLK